MFTAKHFTALAATVAKMTVAHRLAAAIALADMSSSHNPNFDRERFLDACNVVSIEQAAFRFNRQIERDLNRGTFSIGIGGDVLVCYEHAKSPLNKTTKAIRFFEGFPVRHKYIGKIIPA